jgi:ribonuclease HI
LRRINDPKNTVDYVTETLAMVHGMKRKKDKPIKTDCTCHGPPTGVIKLNSDGAIKLEAGRAASGGVARDADGFLSAWCHVYQGITDSLTIEALALRDAVVVASNQHYDRISAEMDSAELVRLWSERGNHRAMIAPTIEEINELSIGFSSFELVFVRRTANKATHECARHACAHDVSREWLGESPPFLSYSLMDDCNTDGYS